MTRKKSTKKPSQKELFRRSKEWKDFRTHMASVFGNKDYVTGRKLSKKFNLHHMRTKLTDEEYQDISDESNFIPLNPYTHKFLHYLFPTYKKDPRVIERFVELLEKMREFEKEMETKGKEKLA